MIVECNICLEYSLQTANIQPKAFLKLCYSNPHFCSTNLKQQGQNSNSKNLSQIYIAANHVILIYRVQSNWVIVVHQNLKKPPKRRSRDFFHAICLRRCPMARTTLKRKHMVLKFNPGVKMMKNSQRNDYLLKKLFVALFFFSVIAH